MAFAGAVLYGLVNYSWINSTIINNAVIAVIVKLGYNKIRISAYHFSLKGDFMKITINENLKKFRKAKGNTQQELADHLGISIQAVSKWECGDGYPDITLIPAIALYYNVTSDQLLGMEENVMNAKIEEYIERYNEACRKSHSRDERIAIMREAQREFPSNHKILYYLIECLWWYKENHDEVIEIGERLLSESTDNFIRENTVRQLFMSCIHNKKDYETAKRYADMASSLINSRDALYFQCLSLLPDGDEMLKEVQNNIQTFLYVGYEYFICNLFELTDTVEDKLKISESVLTIFQSVYTDGDFGRVERFIADIYHKFARCHVYLGDTDKALSDLNEMAEHYIKYFTCDEFQHTSPMVNKVQYERFAVEKTYAQEMAADTIKEIEERKTFDLVRNDPRYIAAIEKLRSF